MTTAAIILALALFAGVALWKTEWGIYLIILLLPTYQIRFQIAGIPLTFLEGMILLLAAVVIIKILLSLRGVATLSQSSSKIAALLAVARNEKLTNLFILLLLIAAGISVFIGPGLAKAAGIFKAYFLEAVLFYFLMRLVIDSPKKLEMVYRSLAALALYLSVFGLYQFITLQNLPASWWAVDVASRRIVSVLNHPNALALILGPILAILIIRKHKGKLAWAAIGFGSLAFYLTFSRAAWLALVITLTITGLWGEHKKKVIAASLAAVLVVMIIPFSRGKILELVRHDDPSKQNRYVLWSAAADMLKKSPITGMGLMGFREAFKAYPVGPDRVVQNYPHNFFLTFWVETGLLGLISMLGLLFLFYRKIYKTLTSPTPPHEEGTKGRSGSIILAAASGMAMIILHSMVDVSYFKNDLSVLFWLIYSLPYIKQT